METLQQAVALAETQGTMDKGTLSAQFRIGEILYALDRPVDALQHFQQLLKEYETARDSGRAGLTLLERAELDARFYWDTAAICLELKQLALADEYLNRSLTQCQKYIRAAPHGCNTRWRLATVHGFLGKSKLL